LSTREKASEAESFNYIGIARSQFHGFADRRMADCSGAREQRMSEGLTSAPRRQKKPSNFTVSPSNYGKNETRKGCATVITIYPFGISEAGKSIASQRKTGGCIDRRIHSPPFWDW
jgi:hypothetical protein